MPKKSKKIQSPREKSSSRRNIDHRQKHLPLTPSKSELSARNQEKLIHDVQLTPPPTDKKLKKTQPGSLELETQTPTKSSLLDKKALKLVIDDDLRHKLKKFDLNLNFGPCIGISRLERWKRAQKLRKNPDPKIRDILLQISNEIDLRENMKNFKSSIPVETEELRRMLESEWTLTV